MELSELKNLQEKTRSEISSLENQIAVSKSVIKSAAESLGIPLSSISLESITKLLTKSNEDIEECNKRLESIEAQYRKIVEEYDGCSK